MSLADCILAYDQWIALEHAGMQQHFSKNIITENGENEFQVRFIKQEGVGLLTTRNEINYLVLDSLEYWYDLIQNGYPKKKKCSCKNEWFYVRFDYVQRAGTDDIREVNVFTTCTSCGKLSKALSVDIDYSPTEELVAEPIHFCEKPDIRYKYSQLTSYWSGNDLKEVLHFIFNDLKLHAYCWFFKHPEDNRFFEKVTFEKAMQIVTVNHRYLNFYFSLVELDIAKYSEHTDKRGVYLTDAIWRKEEIIQLSSPTVIAGYGLLYYIHFCNQFLDKGNIRDKSEAFDEITKQVKNWLRLKFVTKRGANCYDGYEAYEKLKAKLSGTG
ncbi:MAG: hypothetical protein QM731_01450 [Chitinophagaceae bacterium]